MQIMIDTSNDSPGELYRIGKYLTDNYAVTAAINETPDFTKPREPLRPAAEFYNVPPSPSPAAPYTMPGYVPADMDPEIETDDENSVKSVTVSATAAPPPPPTLDNVAAAHGLQRLPASLPAAAPVPPGPAATPEYDAKCAPWDSRIHASNRAKKIDGTWKNKRGVSADLITACEAQNKPGNAPVVPAAVTSTPNVTAAASSAITTPPNVPPPPAVPPAPAVPSAVTSSAVPSTGAATTIDFRGLMQKIQSATAANKLTAEQVNAALAGVGLKPEEMAQLINNAPLIASLNAAVEACLAS